MLGVGLGPKRLELLHELIPGAKVFGLLINPTNKVASGVTTRELQAAADTLGLQLQIVHSSGERDYDAAFASLVDARAAGLVIGGDGSFTNRGWQLGALSLRHALPTVYQFQEFAAGGGLMSYGGSNPDSYRLVGVYVRRILKGKPQAELTVEQ
jgi:putative ABC transport system substrate-binding protein